MTKKNLVKYRMYRATGCILDVLTTSRGDSLIHDRSYHESKQLAIHSPLKAMNTTTFRCSTSINKTVASVSNWWYCIPLQHEF